MGIQTRQPSRSTHAPLWLMLAMVFPLSSALAAQYPTVTVDDVIVECRDPAVSVQLDISIEDNDDPLPRIILENPFNNVNPDAYPLGNHEVYVGGCDRSGNCIPNALRPTAIVSVRDTLAPNVRLADYPTSCVKSGNVLRCECDSVGGNSLGFTRDNFQIADLCDPNPFALFELPDDPLYPVGTTTINASVFDNFGNNDEVAIEVQVQDTTPPVFSSTIPDFIVVSQSGECTTDEGNPGTLVRMPRPAVTELCSDPESVLVTFSHATLFFETPENTQCFPDGTHAVELNVYDNIGLSDPASPVFNVQVTSADDLDLTINGSGPVSRLVNSSQVAVSASGLNNVGTTQWVVSAPSTALEGNTQSVASNQSAEFTFADEGDYCPIYLTAFDSVGNSGSDSSVCFGIDRQLPTHTFEGVATSRSAILGGSSAELDLNDVSTWPEYYYGERLELEFDAMDMSGVLNSGVSQVILDILDQFGAVLYTVIDETYSCTEGELGLCPTEVRIEGCNVDSEACVNNRLSLTALSLGQHQIRLRVADGAGNTATSLFPIVVGNLADGFSNLASAIDTVLADLSTPLSARPDVEVAKKFLGDAAILFSYSPGHSLLLARKAWQSLLNAQLSGSLDTSKLRNALVRNVLSEATRLAVEHDNLVNDGTLVDWSPLSNEVATASDDGLQPTTNETYRQRYFLVGDPISFTNRIPTKDYRVDVSEAVRLAKFEISRAKQTNNQDLRLSLSLRAFEALVMLYRDSTYASLFGRPTFEAFPDSDDDRPEAFFQANSPAKFGDATAITVSNQIQRFAQDAADGRFSGINPEILDTMQNVRDQIDIFSNAVQVIKEAEWNLVSSGFDNQRLVEDVYLTAQNALEALATVRDSEVHTLYWQAGLSLTLSYVINFSVYEGPTSLYAILNAPELGDNRRLFNDFGSAWSGSLDNLDPFAQTAECRFSKLMRAVADGRIEGKINAASDLFAQSKCLIVTVYNRLYGNGQYIETDSEISVEGCEQPLDTPNILQECTCFSGQTNAQADDNCDGIDDDCDGAVDEHYEPESCGVGPCQAQSNCIAGQEIECIPLEPQVTVDTTCDAQDNDCDGTSDEEWVATTCGRGLCLNANVCIDGAATECIPLPAEEEGDEFSCDGRDNDCDIAIDEGLDNDQDGFGCEPGTENCSRTSSDLAFRCVRDDGINWDCNDRDASVGPGLEEVCDYKDNNCDTQVDEGVRNACGHCEPTCDVTQFGGEDGLPLNPTEDNSNSISLNEDGTLTVFSEIVDVQFAWVAVDQGGVVSKIDTRTGEEVGRYCTALGPAAPQVPSNIDTDYGRTRGVSNVCGACSSCNRGSRTAVLKGSGDVFIANRAFGSQGTLTKIANLERDCVDLNGNGIIDTAKDHNENGVIDTNAGPGEKQEYLGENDECVLWTRAPTSVVDGYSSSDSIPSTSASSIASKGSGYFLPRALALDADGDIWLGNWRDAGFFEMDPTSGKVKRFVYMGINPYGAVIDSRGILWAPHSCCGQGRMRSFNTNGTRVPLDDADWNSAASTNRWSANEVGPIRTQSWGDRGNYGIAVDGKDRVYLGSYGQNNWAASQYDPANNNWRKLESSKTNGSRNPSAGMGRGVTVGADGVVWVAQHGGWSNGRLTGYDSESLSIVHDLYLGSRGDIPVGVGIGSGGKIWTNNQRTQNLTAYDPRTGAYGFYPEDVSPNQNLRASLYTYSDFTGNLSKTFTDPEGRYRENVNGCNDGPVANWARLDWSLTSRPANTTAKLRVRSSDTPAAMDDYDHPTWGDWYPSDGYFEIADGALDGSVEIDGLPNVTDRYLQVEVVMVANSDNQKPTLRSFSVARTCDR